MQDRHGYYLYYGTDSDGVARKIEMQMAEFGKILPFEKLSLSRPKNHGAQKLLRALPTATYGYNYEEVFEQMKDPAAVYMRQGLFDADLIRFFRRVKAAYPHCVTIIEFPSFPYLKDRFSHGFKGNLRSIPIHVKDLLIRGKLKSCVDYISTFSDYPRIYGVPTLHIRNGIRVDDITPLTGTEDDTVDLFAVALMAKHHGFERIIQGIADYYRGGGRRKVLLHLVGNGVEQPRYEKMVADLGIGEHVKLYGRRVGAELDAIYERADLAVASLGIYKLGLKVGSFIKTGEYLSKGLPMITGSPVDVLDHADFPYFLEFPNDASPIDIGRVIDFYDKIYGEADRAAVIHAVRAYAYKKLDISVALQPVTDVMRAAAEEQEQ